MACFFFRECCGNVVVGETDGDVSNAATQRLYYKTNESKEWHLIKGMEYKCQRQLEKLKQVNDTIVSFIG